MANDLNLCQFIGRLGQDPEIKYLPSGKAVANFSIAVGAKWKDKQTGQPQEHTEWVKCDAFERTAEIIGEYLRKGSRVYVSGSWRTRKWTDQGGTDHYTTSLRINQMQMLDPPQQSQQGQAQAQQQAPAQNQGQANHQQAPQGQQQGGGFDAFDDDIPFDMPYRGLALNAV
ncbi:MAG: single-stranded DNA-binding protein [Pseudooceanicola sp.]|nr:single-stranded DNA-binding protein [Pseudooceanicola sp.]|tara:strand:- start:408 stop:920 length:513 start_codon:yes stop_codon:yes gene_type:complete